MPWHRLSSLRKHCLASAWFDSVSLTPVGKDLRAHVTWEGAHHALCPSDSDVIEVIAHSVGDAAPARARLCRKSRVGTLTCSSSNVRGLRRVVVRAGW